MFQRSSLRPLELWASAAGATRTRRRAGQGFIPELTPYPRHSLRQLLGVRGAVLSQLGGEDRDRGLVFDLQLSLDETHQAAHEPETLERDAARVLGQYGRQFLLDLAEPSDHGVRGRHGLPPTRFLALAAYRGEPSPSVVVALIECRSPAPVSCAGDAKNAMRTTDAGRADA